MSSAEGRVAVMGGAFKFALVVSLLLIAAALYEGVAGQRFEIAAGDHTRVWRLDRRTGNVSLCLMAGVQVPAKCTPWGAVPFGMSPADFQRLIRNAEKATGSHQ